jgi:succinate dehydrogenase/fumarate reductase flavoprotein subunit
MAGQQQRVIVIGSGAAGLSAALSATSSGAAVTVLEAADLLGGTTAFSGGGVWVPANRWGAAEGITDTVDEGIRYLRSIGQGDSDPAVAETFCRRGAGVIERIESLTPLRWNTIRGYPDYYSHHDGGKRFGRTLEIDSCPLGRAVLDQVRPDPFDVGITSRAEAAAGLDREELDRRRSVGLEARGRGLIGGLLVALQDKGVDVRRGVRVSGLETRGDSVVGVRAGGQEFSGMVIVATGGFERDASLVKTFLPAPLAAPASAPTHIGDGLRMGMALGAALGNMGEAWWSPAMGVPGETIDGAQLYYQLMTEPAFPGGIVVDSRGRRFVDETMNKSEVGRTMREFDPSVYGFPRLPSYLIFDAGRRHSRRVGPLRPDDPDPDWLFKAETIEALATRVGVPVEGLCETVERYNAHAGLGFDADFGRGSNFFSTFQTGEPDIARQLRPLTEPPFYGVRMWLGCLGTKGGLRIDSNARVLRSNDGRPIPGLYAAGNASANPFGYGYPGGGGTIGPALIFGWLAGEHAAAA